MSTIKTAQPLSILMHIYIDSKDKESQEDTCKETKTAAVAGVWCDECQCSKGVSRQEISDTSSGSWQGEQKGDVVAENDADKLPGDA